MFIVFFETIITLSKNKRIIKPTHETSFLVCWYILKYIFLMFIFYELFLSGTQFPNDWSTRSATRYTLSALVWDGNEAAADRPSSKHTVHKRLQCLAPHRSGSRQFVRGTLGWRRKHSNGNQSTRSTTVLFSSMRKRKETESDNMMSIWLYLRAPRGAERYAVTNNCF